jgi:hypothetical protein
LFYVKRSGLEYLGSGYSIRQAADRCKGVDGVLRLTPCPLSGCGEGGRRKYQRECCAPSLKLTLLQEKKGKGAANLPPFLNLPCFRKKISERVLLTHS